MKQCYKCKEVKETTEFYKKSSNTTDSLSGRCKKCDNTLKDDWRKRNPEKRRAYERKRIRTITKTNSDRIRNRKYRKELSDQYICYLIRVSSKNLISKDIPNELIEAYRLNLKLKRALRLTPKLKSST